MASPDRLALGRQIYRFFLQQGLAPHQAAAIAGNMAWEGGGRADLVNPGDNWRNSPNAPHSIGIAQWNDRSPALIAFARAQGIDIPEGDLRDPRYAQEVIRRIPLETQLQFAWAEMQGPERRAYDAILAGTDLSTATAGAIGYHRPAGWTRGNPYAGHGFGGRLSLAQRILADGGSDASSPAPGAPRPPGGPLTVAGTDTAGGPRTPPSSPLGAAFGALFSGGQPGEQDQTGLGPGISQGDQSLAQAVQARIAAAAADAPATVALAAPPPQLDLTRLRTLLQGRGRLGTGGTYG